MEANELRLGNVTSAGIVVEIHRDYFYTHNLESSFRSSWFDVNPVLLDEECLIKFEFKQNETYCSIHIKSGIELMNIANKYFRGRYKGALITKDIEYVHQLQNLYFALTNKELTL
jgi:hypothetical protein